MGVPLNLRVKLMAQHNKRIEKLEKEREKEKKSKLSKKVLDFLFSERYYKVDNVQVVEN